jgi:uncharacterized protein HemY
MAIEAVQRIAVQSELRQIMEEAGSEALTTWLSQLDTLIARTRKRS